MLDCAKRNIEETAPKKARIPSFRMYQAESNNLAVVPGLVQALDSAKRDADWRAKAQARIQACGLLRLPKRSIS